MKTHSRGVRGGGGSGGAFITSGSWFASVWQWVVHTSHIKNLFSTHLCGKKQTLSLKKEADWIIRPSTVAPNEDKRAPPAGRGRNKPLNAVLGLTALMWMKSCWLMSHRLKSCPTSHWEEGETAQLIKWLIRTTWCYSVGVTCPVILSTGCIYYSYLSWYFYCLLTCQELQVENSLWLILAHLHVH